MSQKAAKATKQAKRLGALLRSLREEQGISGNEMVRRTGLGRSYLAYLEEGAFADIGLTKFTSLLRELQQSADWVLGEAGYLPRAATQLGDLRVLLREHFKLTPAQQDHAVSYIEFLAAQAKGKGGRTKTND